MHRQKLLSIFFLFAVTCFGAGLIFALLRFALPRGEWIQVGVVSHFPPSEEPYRLRNPDGFIVNIGGEITVLSDRPPHPRFQDTCLISWETELSRFQEPCGGAFFALDGSYLGGPSPRAMDSFPVRIEEDEVWVEITTQILGEPLPTAPPDTPIPAEPPH